MKTIVALALMALSAGAAAQINKCLDASGKVVGYGNECPPGTRSEASGVKVTPPPAPAKAATAEGAAKSEKGADKSADKGAAKGADKGAAKGADKGQDKSAKAAPESAADVKKREAAKQEADAKKAAADVQNKQACEESRGYLKSLQSGNRITKRDAKTGERLYMQDNEYASEIAKTQAVIKANCG
jgi:hypothetical protein